MVWCGMLLYGKLLFGMLWYSMLWYGMVSKYCKTSYLFHYNDPIIMHLSLHDGMHMSQKYPQML